MRISTGCQVAVIGFLLTACALAATPEPTATPTPAPTATDTEAPPTPTAAFTPTDTAVPTATPFAPFEIVVARTDAANLRAGPGYLFLIVKILQPGTKAMLLGRSLGSEWFYVQVSDSLKGWVYGKLLNQDDQLLNAPIIEPDNASMIRGRVLDTAGIPLSGIVFTVRLSTSPDRPPDIVSTDPTGEFYSFLPYFGGVWTVTFSKADCSSNVWFDRECEYYKKGYLGIVSPPARAVRLPQEGILEFTWK
jgi:uncharacterized protein YgiM (DUF1202 family)